jgi:hypothetical protein
MQKQLQILLMIFSDEYWKNKLASRREADAFPIKFPDIRTIPTTDPGVKIKIAYLKPDISYGYGETTRKVLKVLSSLINQLLTHNYNHSVLIEIFPEEPKSSHERPL